MTDAHQLSVLVLNTYLLRILPLPESSTLRVSGAPYATKRAAEIRTVLADYDVAALCEVFASRDIQTLRKAHPHFRTRLGAHTGPGAGGGRFTSSGLLTLSKQQIVRTAAHRFHHRGSLVHDPDAHAAKGISLAEIDLGRDRNLEVFNTHLIAGNDLIPRQKLGRSTDEVSEVRLAQVDEVMSFVDKYHRTGNATLVVGDFNVDADSTEGKNLRVATEDSGFVDLWDSDLRGVGSTSDLLTRPEHFIVDPTDERFFADISDPDPACDPAPARIDYAFWRPGQSGIAVDRIRRRALPRKPDAHGRDTIAWMADHAGLHLDLKLT